MNTKIWLLLCATSVLCVDVLSAGQKPKSIQPAPSRKTTTTPKDDLYIDDDTEGSGGSNLDGKDDLESAGSGFGPDDEDAERDSVTFSAPKNRNANTRNKSVGKGSSLLPLPTTKAQPMPPVSPTPPPPTTTEVFDKDYTLKKGASDEFATTVNILEKNPVEEGTRNGSGGVFIINHHEKERTSSFFAQPGILAAVIGGAVVGLLCAILVVMFIVYRMKKKDEGSYVLEEMKRSPPTNPYMKTNHREFFA